MKKKLLTFLGIIILLFLLIFAYAYFLGTKGLIVNEIKITNNSLPDNFHGFKIIHISDIHYGRTVDVKKIKKIVDKINLLKPDIVLLTGDLLDRSIKLSDIQTEELIDNLKNIDVSIDKYAISGNHDYDYDIKSWLSIIENSDFINLNDKYELIYNLGNVPIVVNGMSSNLHGELTVKEKLKPFNDLMSDNDIVDIDRVKPVYNIMMMHEPDYINDFERNQFNLILTGHSHNGQVRLPFIGALVKPVGAKEYYDEYYKLENTDLYISGGLGTSILDVRLFNKPSFNFYRLSNK
ncbi:MAG: metallophosphoesterase [Bacilli bacterium]|nr:metallophosphoesterase [Bacilli bacterium]MDD4282871.1 metallophosphoesterase [Bacilli bacterium]MDD4718303.1 metallophosphoesterase [Bacilli bacterium]